MNALSLPVLHTGKATDADAKTASRFALAQNPPRLTNGLAYDENRPENCFSATSYRRGKTLLSEGYRVSLWGIENRKTGTATFCVETPKGHNDPYYFVTLDGSGSASCDCARVGLGNRPCCHIAAVVYLCAVVGGVVIRARELSDGVTLLVWRDADGFVRESVGEVAK